MQYKTYFLVYARKSGRHDWNNFGRSDSALQCTNQAYRLLQDIEKDARYIGCNWQVKMITVTMPIESSYDVPVTLKANVNWYDVNMIPFGSMQQNPNQALHNGGN